MASPFKFALGAFIAQRWAWWRPLIVLGESILAATVAVQSALSSGEAGSSLAPLVVGGLLIAYAMWWLYFDRPAHDLLVGLRKAIRWGAIGSDLVDGRNPPASPLR